MLIIKEKVGRKSQHRNRLHLSAAAAAAAAAAKRTVQKYGLYGKWRDNSWHNRFRWLFTKYERVNLSGFVKLCVAPSLNKDSYGVLFT
jgi:hypothetical protein